jgi:hypothetical protein
MATFSLLQPEAENRVYRAFQRIIRIMGPLSVKDRQRVLKACVALFSVSDPEEP